MLSVKDVRFNPNTLIHGRRADVVFDEFIKIAYDKMICAKGDDRLFDECNYVFVIGDMYIRNFVNNNSYMQQAHNDEIITLFGIPVVMADFRCIDTIKLYKEVV